MAMLPYLSIDTETTGLDIFSEGFGLVGLVIASGNEALVQGYYVPLMLEVPPELVPVGIDFTPISADKVRSMLVNALLNRRSPPIYHNAPFDMLVLHRTLGISLELLEGHDTMLAAQLLNENASLSLKELARQYLGAPAEKAQFSATHDKEFWDRLYTVDIETKILKNGKTRKTNVWRISNDWQERAREIFVSEDHDGAVSYRYMREFTRAMMTNLRARGVIDYDGVYPDGFQYFPIWPAVIYAIDDVYNTLELWQFLQMFFLLNPELEDLYQEIQLPVSHIMTRATARGLLIDIDLLKDAKALMGRRIEELSKQAEEIAARLIPAGATITPSEVLTSYEQLRTLLFDILGFRAIGVTGTGKASTSKDNLDKLLSQTPKKRLHKADAHTFIRLKLELGALQKLQSTYTDSLLEKLDSHQRLHAFYNITGTVSGRMSSSNPNIQNIPRLTEDEVEERPHLKGVDIRAAMVADPEYVYVVADYENMEMVATAGQSGDENLKKLLAEKRDMHAFTARTTFKVGLDLDDKAFKKAHSVLRQRAKTVNFL
jgi:DNA polymerase I-like protein with 3'-5' exonuclease and polymerase domains